MPAWSRRRVSDDEVEKYCKIPALSGPQHRKAILILSKSFLEDVSPEDVEKTGVSHEAGMNRGLFTFDEQFPATVSNLTIAHNRTNAETRRYKLHHHLAKGRSCAIREGSNCGGRSLLR